MNIRFCTCLMGQPFFSCAILTSRVLPYSMIVACIHVSLPHLVNTYKVTCTKLFTKLTKDLSEQFRSLSWSRYELPWASSESRSISPNRIPPALLRPFTGWWVRISIGPVVRTCSKKKRPVEIKTCSDTNSYC